MKLNQAIEKLIENPKDVYECTLGNRYELSVSRNGFFHLIAFNGNEKLDRNSNRGGFSGNLKVNTDWQLKRQPVCFMTAMNSGKDSKPIIEGTACDFRNAEYWLSVTKLNLDMVNGKWLVE